MKKHSFFLLLVFTSFLTMMSSEKNIDDSDYDFDNVLVGLNDDGHITVESHCGAYEQNHTIQTKVMRDYDSIIALICTKQFTPSGRTRISAFCSQYEVKHNQEQLRRLELWLGEDKGPFGYSKQASIFISEHRLQGIQSNNFSLQKYQERLLKMMVPDRKNIKYFGCDVKKQKQDELSTIGVEADDSKFYVQGTGMFNPQLIKSIRSLSRRIR